MNKSIVVAAALLVVTAAPAAGGSMASKTIDGCVIKTKAKCAT